MRTNMENKLTVKLSNKHVKYLENLPEEGMGYQIVDIELSNGLKVKNRIVLNATYLKLLKDEKFNNNDIKNIKIKSA